MRSVCRIPEIIIETARPRIGSCQQAQDSHYLLVCCTEFSNGGNLCAQPRQIGHRRIKRFQIGSTAHGLALVSVHRKLHLNALEEGLP